MIEHVIIWLLIGFITSMGIRADNVVDGERGIAVVDVILITILGGISLLVYVLVNLDREI